MVLPSSFQSKTCERPLWSPRFSPASFSATVCSQLLGTSSQRLPLYPSSHTACSVQKAFPSGKRHWTWLASSTTTWPGVGSFPCLPVAGFFHNIAAACSPVLFFLAFLSGHRLRDPSVFFISALSAMEACWVHSSCSCCQHMEIPVHSND